MILYWHRAMTVMLLYLTFYGQTTTDRALATTFKLLCWVYSHNGQGLGYDIQAAVLHDGCTATTDRALAMTFLLLYLPLYRALAMTFMLLYFPLYRASAMTFMLLYLPLCGPATMGRALLSISGQEKG